MNPSSAQLFYVHDPMCSWCWGFRPVWDALQQVLPNNVEVINVTGGLAKDSDETMPLELQHAIQGWWKDISAQLGTEFNHDFWALNTPRRSTFMSCRATIAASYQRAEDAMIDAIQRAYYLRAENPSDVSVLTRLAEELGLDAERFTSDLLSHATEVEFSRQLALARSLPIDGFPSLVLQVQGKVIPISRDYLDHNPMLNAIHARLTE